MVQIDPVLEALKRLETKVDKSLANQEAMDEELRKIHKDCRRVSIVSGAVAGGLSGGVVAGGLAFIKAKLGF